MVSNAKNEIIIVSPWIKVTTMQKIINATNQKENIKWKVLSRADHEDFYLEASDIEAFKIMIENKSFDVRAIKQLHAKFYIVDDILCLLTSANLTVSGMEINKEAGIVFNDSSELRILLDEFKSWFNQAKLLDKSWLVKEQKKLSETRIRKPVGKEIPFDPSDYHHPDLGNGSKPDGKYRELPLPKIWIPTLDSLKEIENTDFNHSTISDLISSVDIFYKYVGTRYSGKRTQKFLLDWFVHKKPLVEIGNEFHIERERISQIIGKRKRKPDNIWNSLEGNAAICEISLFLSNATERAELTLSTVLSSTRIQPLDLSQLDLCKFVCGMIDNKIVNGNYLAKITSTNQLLIYDLEIYEILKKMDRIYQKDYQRFMDFKEYCQLGELGNITDAWFNPELKLFKNLYLTKGMQIGSRRWNLEKSMWAIAWELADKSEYYHWHYSEMREALKYIFPERFNKLGVRYVNNRLSANPDEFHYAGSKGFWQLTDLGDGYRNNKEAIVSIFNRVSNQSLNYKYIIDELQGMGRRVNEESIYILLERDESFIRVGQGEFHLVEKSY